MRKIEILAPAGSYEGMRAAMNAGCDAVYIGGSSFGARAYADNPDEENLLRAIDEAHIRDKKLYLTVNTLLKEKELTGRLYDFLEKFYRQGLDAVIVQDVGVMHFIHKYFPELPIHASTQMTLTMAQGANVLKSCGVSRIVTSRELSFQEIKTIRENTELEIETFVHGALCYCYSGQCLMSSVIGGRSGNRGRCAQPCRMAYRFYQEGLRQGQEEDKYLLSPKDINTIANIPELVEAGVDSFKIEGRMKRPEYAAAVVSMYRKYLDRYWRLGTEGFRELIATAEYEKDMLLLQDVYNRGGFSSGYGNVTDKKSMMSMRRPNHSGVYVGEVTKVNGSKVLIRLIEEVHPQDILEIRTSSEEGYEFTVKDKHSSGENLETNIGIYRNASDKEKRKPPVIKAGMQVYRTRNNELLETLAEKYLRKNRQLGIRGTLTARIGERLTLTIEYKQFHTTVFGEIIQQAIKQPMTTEKLSAPIYKTGDTLFYFTDFVVEADDNIFVPVVWLNEIRRQALLSLPEIIAGHYRRRITKAEDAAITDVELKASALISDMEKTQDGQYNTEGNNQSTGITVSIQTPEQFETVLSFPEITNIIVEYDLFESGSFVSMAEMAHESGRAFYLGLPHICRAFEYRALEMRLGEFMANEHITGFMVKNFEEVSLLQSLLTKNHSEKQMVLNHNMYVFNKEAKSFWQERGINNFTAPLELNRQELKTLGVSDCDILVYGYLPLMVSTLCLFHNTAGCNKSGIVKEGVLTDRLKKKFHIQAVCASCNNVIYNGEPLALHKQLDEIIAMHPRNIRMDFTFEKPEDVKRIVKGFVDSIKNESKTTFEITDYTTGHFKRGVE